MDRVVGIETEYGCLLSEDEPHVNSELWPAKVKNYLLRREAQFTPPILGTLLTFLVTRQIFTGAGRVGQSNPLAFDFEPPQPEGQVNFQLSQRADHIVNDIYQWVQFNRAIINARD